MAALTTVRIENLLEMFSDIGPAEIAAMIGVDINDYASPGDGGDAPTVGFDLDALYRDVLAVYDNEDAFVQAVAGVSKDVSGFVDAFMEKEGIAYEDSDEIARAIRSGETTITDLRDTREGAEETFSAGEDESLGGADPDNLVTIQAGLEMDWFYDENTGMYYVAYGLPGSDMSMVFEATQQQMDQIFGVGLRPVSSVSTLNEIIAAEDAVFAGDISEMSGEGSFEENLERVVAIALDEGILPDWATATPEIMDIVYVAAIEDKSAEWILDQISRTESFAQRFPEITTLTDLGLTIEESVNAFLEFETGLKELALRSGYEEAITPEIVGDLIAQGQSMDDVAFVFDIFDQMESNSGALAAFNDVLAANNLAPLTPDQQFEFLAGNAPKELYEIWEQTSFLDSARAAGLSSVIDADEAISLANRTTGLTSQEAAIEGMQAAAQLILRFRGEVDSGALGLNQEDLIDLSLGLAPRSGTSAAVLQEQMQRAINNAGLKRDNAQPFYNFGPDGTPQAVSLRKLLPSGG